MISLAKLSPHLAANETTTSSKDESEISTVEKEEDTMVNFADDAVSEESSDSSDSDSDSD